MTDIVHNIRIGAPRSRVYEALTTIDGLAAWWTQTTDGDCATGETIAFRFGEHVTKMRVEAQEPQGRVVWRCTESAPDWVDTRVTFKLTDEEEGTLLRFGHRDWQQSNDFQAHCSMKWATFLLSLKAYVESGKGTPFPDDIAI